jgi:hypothetical protein
MWRRPVSLPRWPAAGTHRTRRRQSAVRPEPSPPDPARSPKSRHSFSRQSATRADFGLRTRRVALSCTVLSSCPRSQRHAVGPQVACQLEQHRDEDPPPRPARSRASYSSHATPAWGARPSRGRRGEQGAQGRAEAPRTRLRTPPQDAPVSPRRCFIAQWSIARR